MQPTPRTSTRSESPSSLTAFSSCFLTPSPCDDMQPAAMQQRSVNFFRAASSFSLIRRRSLRSMFHPFLELFQGGIRRLARRDRAVIDDGRGDAAGANATGREQGNLVVRGGLARF